MAPAPRSTETTSTQRSDQSRQEGKFENIIIFRDLIALIVLTISIAAVGWTSYTVIQKGGQQPGASERVMDSTLPLYGTWVGTILAFYFTRNAFEAGSNSAVRMQQATNALASSSPPEDKLSKIKLKSLANDLVFSVKNDVKTLLQDVVKDLEEKGRYRIIVVDSSKKYVSLIYRINAKAYLMSPQEGTVQTQEGTVQTQEGTVQTQEGTVQPSVTLDQYLKWRKAEKATIPVVFLPEDATLADADTQMKAISGCRDVIVTKDGTATGEVVVYVTDYDIDQYR